MTAGDNVPDERFEPASADEPWLRSDIRANVPYTDEALEFALGLLAHAGRWRLRAAVHELADEYRRSLFETLATLPATELSVEPGPIERDKASGASPGTLIVCNLGLVGARLVRGALPDDGEGRIRDGFVDLLPGESRSLRFEAADQSKDHVSVRVAAQNAPAVAINVRVPPD